MAEHIYLRVLAAKGDGVEATLHKYHNGEKLAEGTWKVVFADGTEELREIASFPPHWRDQLEKLG